MIQVCPERDAPCPHGYPCPYARDRYSCDPAGFPAPPQPEPNPLGGEARPCTCHPDERPDICQRKYALSDCRRAALTKESEGG